MEDLQDWIRAIEQTWIVRYPKQNLATFGITNIAYYVVTEPIYREIDQGGQEGVVRKGRVLAEKPTIITPTYALNLEGFRPEAYEYLKQISLNLGPQHPGILYKYKNEPENDNNTYFIIRDLLRTAVEKSHSSNKLLQSFQSLIFEICKKKTNPPLLFQFEFHMVDM